MREGEACLQFIVCTGTYKWMNTKNKKKKKKTEKKKKKGK